MNDGGNGRTRKQRPKQLVKADEEIDAIRRRMEAAGYTVSDRNRIAGGLSKLLGLPLEQQTHLMRTAQTLARWQKGKDDDFNS
jgi:hypothetical protein